MHDVFTIISEGSGGEHIARTVYAASEDDARQTHQKTTPTSPSRRLTNETIPPHHLRRRATSHRAVRARLEDTMDAYTRITRRRQ